MMISKLIRVSLDRALTALEIERIPYMVEPTRDQRFGDWTTNVALQLAKRGGDARWQSSEAIGKAIVGEVGHPLFAEAITVAPPGFINITLSPKWINRELSTISMGDWGDMGDWGKGKRILIEYVSANPTGPLHIGNARSGPIGDTLGRVFTLAGYHVDREYYVNDIGGQVEKLGESLLALGFPERIHSAQNSLEYSGPFYEDLAKTMRRDLVGEYGEEKLRETADEQLCELILKKAVAINLASIERDCQDLRCPFERFVKESEIASSTPAVVSQLSKIGATVAREGALWLKGREEDRDSVLVRQDNRYTYFANDIAYHKDKFDRGYDLIINVWGSNHHGHIPRMESAITLFGIQKEMFRVILYQYVRVKRGHVVVRMSKRLGTFVTAREVLDEVGVDAMRFFLLSRSAGTHLDFDVERATKENKENPVYVVQYAHARICSILRKAATSPVTQERFLLAHQSELALAKKLLTFPELIEEIVEHYTVHLLTEYALDVSRLFHQFYEQRRVLVDDPYETAARLMLVRATKEVLSQTLGMLGITAPVRMEKENNSPKT